MRLQRFIHANYRAVEEGAERAVDSLLGAERAVREGYRWLCRESLAIAVPAVQMASVGGASYLISRRAARAAGRWSPAGPLAISLGLAGGAGIMLCPSWRRAMASAAGKHLEEPFPLAQRALCKGRRAFSSLVEGGLFLWGWYDRTSAEASRLLDGGRERFGRLFRR